MEINYVYWSLSGFICGGLLYDTINEIRTKKYSHKIIHYKRFFNYGGCIGFLVGIFRAYSNMSLVEYLLLNY
jgi:hypothetical protein